MTRMAAVCAWLAGAVPACEQSATVGMTVPRSPDDTPAAPQKDASVVRRMDASVIPIDAGGPLRDGAVGAKDVGAIDVADAAPLMCAKALRDRVRVSYVDLGGRGECTDRHAAPQVITSPLKAGGAHVGFDDPEGIVIVPVDARGLRSGPDRTFPGVRLRGLIARDDGTDVVMYTTVGRVPNEARVLRLAVLDRMNCLVHDRVLLGDNHGRNEGDEWVATDAPGRLAVRGNHLVAYVVVERLVAGRVVRGDRLLWLSADGNDPQTPGWAFDCSEPSDVRLANNGTKTGAMCLSGPAAPTIRLDRQSIVPAVTGASHCPGSVASDGGSFQVAYASSLGRRDGRTDVALARLGTSGSVETVLWLTDTPAVGEVAVRLGRSGDDWLVAWLAGGTRDPHTRELKNAQPSMSWVGRSGRVDGPIALPLGFSEVDDFVTLANDEVAWTTRDGDHRLAVTRIHPCR